MSKSTLKYIGKRLLISLATLFVILVVLFLVVKLLPGSPFNNEKLSEAQRAAIEAKYGLDQPLVTQFITYVKNMLTGDFGVSYNMYKDMPVSSLVGSAAKISFIYGLSAVIIGGLLGTLLGVFAALHKNTIWDTLATIISVIGVSVPSFVFAMMLLVLFASQLHILPTQYSSFNPVVSSIMPVMALSVGVIANVARFTRTEMVSVVNSEYMTLAEAKGLDNKTLIFKHALRNALIPVVTILGPILVNLMTGTMVVEKICGVPGLGKLLINSILSNDVNIILACSFLYAAMYIIMMLIIDVSYGIIDPRIRLGKEDS
ncbi:ABC transporter permease [Allocoprobacillus halotolerans]|uniref:ABC transporter permease n=1 Tax=Allocoprobacillus halotolerans TaxID=2944914 RepID=A0ABY5I7V6_9FIRM|nr:ABC transporter permease [Allocoprobacillus halotolerans]UTY40020.1 ABC transporter permease [Allocoprobacillus halotolerans]